MRAARVLIPVCFALLAACSPRDGQAQPTFAEPNRAAPTDAASMKMSFAPVVQRTAPAVVNISAKRVVRQQVDPFWQTGASSRPACCWLTPAPISPS